MSRDHTCDITIVDIIAENLGCDWHDEYLEFRDDGYVFKNRAAAHFLLKKLRLKEEPNGNHS